ncbi:MAG: hypothetical protein ACFFDK_17665 [Promethearchaeota archaeon]
MNPKNIDTIKKQTKDILEEIESFLQSLTDIEYEFGLLSYDKTVRVEKILLQAKEMTRQYLDRDSVYYQEIMNLTKEPTLFNLKSLTAPLNVLYENLMKKYIPKEDFEFSPLKFDTIIDRIDLEDNIYHHIINEINGTYKNQFFTSVYILSRKLLENLIYDSLKLYYSIQESSKFFNETTSQHHSFGILYENFKSMIKEKKFIKYVQKIDPQYIYWLKEFKDKGNIHAHSLFGLPHQEFIEERRDKINLLIEMLNQVKKSLLGNPTNVINRD